MCRYRNIFIYIYPLQTRLHPVIAVLPISGLDLCWPAQNWAQVRRCFPNLQWGRRGPCWRSGQGWPWVVCCLLLWSFREFYIQLLSWAVALYHLGPVGLIRFIPSSVFKGSLYPKSVCWCCWNSTFRPAHWTTLLGSWENPARFACIQLFAAPRIWHVVLAIVSALDVYMLIPFSRIH